MKRIIKDGRYASWAKPKEYVFKAMEYLQTSQENNGIQMLKNRG
jgi:hypothetical protein